jgi:hypothetical protein
MTTSVTPSAIVINLFINGGFEDSNDTITPWIFNEETSSDTYQITHSSVHGGDNALLVSSNFPSGDSGNVAFHIEQTVTVVPGTAYTFSAYGQILSDPQFQSCEISLIEQSASSRNQLDYVSTTTGSYTYVSVPIVAFSTTLDLQVYVICYTSGVVGVGANINYLLDDIFLVPNLAAPNLITNGGFEDPTVFPWTISGSGATLTIDTSFPDDGTQDGAITLESSSSTTVSMGQPVTGMIVGTTYQIQTSYEVDPLVDSEDSTCTDGGVASFVVLYPDSASPITLGNLDLQMSAQLGFQYQSASITFQAEETSAQIGITFTCQTFGGEKFELFIDDFSVTAI